MTFQRTLLWTALVVFTGTLLVQAQVSGRISGSVVDASGAVVVGAKIHLLLPGGTAPQAATETNQEGIFDLTGIRPELYDLVVEMSGFRKRTISQVKVEPSRQTSLAPVTLEVESVSQAVEVVANAVTVQTANAELSVTVSNEQIRRLPLASRSVQGLINTQAGVSNSRGAVSINGQRTAFTNIAVDGINIQDNFLRDNTNTFSPLLLKLDQVSEFTVAAANTNSAASAGASQMSFVTPSGTNQYHGNLVWQNRNSALGANGWFTNQAGLPKSFLNQNQVGASVGGPIMRDKLFFYFDYELFRFRSQATQTRTILTDDARNGIFTYQDTAGVVRKVNILQATGLSVDPAIRTLLERVPAGSAANSFTVGDSTAAFVRNTVGYAFPQRSNRNTENLTAKGDYVLSTKHSFAGTWLRTHDFVDRTQGAAFYSVPKVTNDDVRNLMSLSWRWSPGPTFTNQLGGGFHYSSALFLNSEDLSKPLAGGLVFSNPVNNFQPQGRQTDTYNLFDNASWVRGRHSLQFGFQMQQEYTAPYDFAGTTAVYNLGLGTNGIALTGAQLPGVRAADLTAANNLLSSLAGLLNDYTRTFNVTSRSSGFVAGAPQLNHFRLSNYAGYVTDTYRVNSRLTVNAGLRYDLYMPVKELNGLGLMPVLQNGNAITTLLSNATLDFASGDGRPFYKTDRNNFAPNVGLAWDPRGNGKTAVRAAYGVYFVNDANIATILNNPIITNGGLVSTVTAQGLNGRFASPTAIPTPAFQVPRTFADNNRVLGTGAAFGMPSPDLVSPYVQQWSIGLQREFKGVVLEARYLGNHGTKLFRSFDLNQVIVRENGFLADFQRARSNGFLAQQRTGVFAAAYNPSIPGSQPLTVFPLLGSGGLLTNGTVVGLIQTGQVGELANIYQTNRLQGSVNFYRQPLGLGTNLITNYSNSSYHALQLEARGRFRGLQVQGNYTWSKNLSDSAGDVQLRFEPFLDAANAQIDRARTSFDLAHNIKANWVYDIPMGRGHRFNHSKLERLLSGWSMSGIMNWQSGTPFSILSARGTLNRGARSGLNTVDTTLTREELDKVIRFQMTGNGPIFIAPSVKGPDGRGVAGDGLAPFSGQVFFNPVPGTIGNLQRRQFSGPWAFNLDFGLQKTTRITERQSVEIRFEATNFFNHATFFVGDEGAAASAPRFNINQPTFGTIAQNFYGPRVIQLGLHYRF